MTNTSLQTKSVQIATGLGFTTFRASSRWLWRWKRRYSIGICCSTNNSQKVPSDYADQIMQFRKTIIAVRKTKKIDPSHMDQTMCRFDMPPARTNIRGEKNNTDQDNSCREERIHCGSSSSSRWDKTSCHNHL